MIVEKELLRLGRLQTPNGVLEATPAWADERVAQYRRMRAKGATSPVAWGHSLKALPLDPEKAKDEQRYHASKYKAGNVLDLRRDGDRLLVKLDVPAVKRIDESGNLIHEVEIDGQKKEAAINEVSAGFQDWQDGQGELHQDALIHVALCPLPVSMGQEGFRQVPETKPVLMLSTASYLGAIGSNVDSKNHSQRTELATEPKAMPDELKEKGTETTESEKPEAEEKTEKPDETKTPTKPVGDMLKVIGDKFKIGLPDTLPGDPLEALEMLYVAACAIGGPTQEEELMAATSPNINTSGGLMLSTAMKDKSWAGTMARTLDKNTREGLKARIAKLKGRGLQKEDEEAMLAQVPALELSANPETGEVVETPLHRMLTVLERNLPSRKELATETELEEVPNPIKSTREKAEQTLQALEDNGVIEPAKK